MTWPPYNRFQSYGSFGEMGFRLIAFLLRILVDNNVSREIQTYKTGSVTVGT